MTTETLSNPYIGPVTGRPVPPLSWAADRTNAFERTIGCTIENLFGRRKHASLYADWAEHVLPNDTHAFARFLSMAKKNVTVATGAMPTPETTGGGTLCVFNHPFGLWDGFVGACVVEAFGRPFKFVAHEHYAVGMPHLADLVLPISWAGNSRAARANLKTVHRAIAELNTGHTVGIYPAGQVATAPGGFGHAVEQPWQPILARIVMETRCTIVPAFCEGQLGRSAQLARAIHPALGELTQLTDFYRKFGEDLRLHVGEPVAFENLHQKTDRQSLTLELQERTLDLGRAAGAYPHPSVVGWSTIQERTCK